MVFFDISKAFDRVWHKGLLFKLKQNGINGKLVLWISNLSITCVYVFPIKKFHVYPVITLDHLTFLTSCLVTSAFKHRFSGW